MSNSIDERIVSMEFDNKRFEKGVSTSIGSIEKLKSALDFKNAEKSLNSFDRAARNFSFGDIGNTLQVVTSKFSILGTIGDQVIRNLTNKAMQLEYRLLGVVKSLSVDQISAGFDKYAQKTEAVQVIMNATGKDIDEVNEVLTKLNKYTDETSYSFTEMTNSIGKFTSAGVDLDVAERAMEGIANWAAKAGVGPEKAASAFYNMSQAIGTGALKLQDWKSIENLNMATKDVKQQFIEAAVNAGTLTKETKNVNGEMKDFYYTNIQGQKKTAVSVEDFNSSLAKGWLNKDVILSTMEKYSDTTKEFGLNAFHAAQEAKTFKDAIDATKDAVSTGWMQTFELIFGNYEEARVLWTDMANRLIEVFAGPAEERNELLSEWHLGGGYEAMIESFTNTWEYLISLIQTVKDAWASVFPKVTSDRLIEITERVRDFTSKLGGLAELFNKYKEFTDRMNSGDMSFLAGRQRHEVISIDTLKKITAIDVVVTKLKKAFEGIKAVVDIVKNAFSALKRTLDPLFKLLGPLADKVLDLAASLGQWLKNLANTIIENDSIYNFLQKIIKPFKTLYGILSSIFGKTNKEKKTFSDFIDSFKNSKLVTSFASALERVKTFFSSSEGIKNVIKNAGTAIVNFIRNLGPKLIGYVQNLDFNKVIDIIKLGIGGGLALKLGGLIGKIFETFSAGKGAINSITGIFDSIGDSISAFTSKLKGDTADTLSSLAKSIGIFVVALIALSMIEPTKLAMSLGALGGLFIELEGAIAILNRISNNSKNVKKAASSMIPIAAAVLILSFAMKTLAGLSWDEIIKGLISIVVLMAALVGVSHTLSEGSKKMKKAASALIPFSVAIFILTASVRKIGEMDTEQLKKGLIGVGALIGALAIFMMSTGLSKFKFGSGLGLVLLAAAVQILYNSVSKFGEMDSGQLKQGLIGVGLILGIVSIISIISGQAKHIIKSALAFIIVGIALKTFSGVISDLGTLQLEDLIKGLSGMAIALILVVGSLMILKSGGVLKAAAALIIVGAALISFSLAIKLLSTIPLNSLLISLGAIAGVLIMLGVASLVLGPVLPILFGLAGVLALFGVAVALAGVGMLAFSVALTTFAATGSVSVSLIIEMFRSFIDGIVSLAGNIKNAIVALITVAAQALVEAVIPIGNAAGQLIIGVLEILRDYLPSIMIEIVYMIIDLINGLAEAIRTIGEAGLFPAIKNLFSAIIELILSLLQSLLGSIPGIGNKIAGALETAKDKINEALTEDKPVEVEVPIEVKTFAESNGVNTSDIIPIKSEEAKESGSELGLDIVEGIVGGMDTGFASGSMEETMSKYFGENGQMNSLFGNLGTNYIANMQGTVDEASSAGSELVTATIEAIEAEAPRFDEAGKDHAERYSEEGLYGDEAAQAAAVSGGLLSQSASDQMNSNDVQNNFYTAGRNAGQGFVNGLGSMETSIAQKAARLAVVAYNSAKKALDSNSPSKKFIELGQYGGEGFGIGLTSMIPYVTKSSEQMANSSIDPIRNSIAQISDYLSNDMDTTPVIRPVLDLTDINDGMNAMGGYFGNRTIGLSSLGAARRANVTGATKGQGAMDGIQNGSGKKVEINITTQQLDKSTVDYLIRRANKVLGGAV